MNLQRRFTVEHEGYTDKRLYAPKHGIEKLPGITRVSHEDHSDTDYPVHRYWTDSYAFRDVFIRVTVHPEAQSRIRGGVECLKARYRIDVRAETDTLSVDETIRRIMAEAGAQEELQEANPALS